MAAPTSGPPGPRRLCAIRRYGDLVVADRVAQLVGDQRPAPVDARGELLEADLVLEVVLVEQRRLHRVEVAALRALELLVALEEDVVLEHHRPEADLLRDLEQLPAPVGALEAVEHGRQLGLPGEPLLLDHDREPEVDRQDHDAQRAVVLGDEVVERGHHAVARPALLERVAHRGVEPAALEQLLAARAHALLRVRLAELLGDLLGRVVEVAPAVGPQHVVHDQDRQRSAGAPSAVGEQPELVVHGVPVVVAVDERRVHRRERREDVEAQRLVEEVPPGERPARARRGRSRGPGR